MTKNEEYIRELKVRLGLQWKQDSLLNQALKHKSFSYENRESPENNQRLEFLGDAVLELVISHYLYRSFPDSQEGDLTRLRAALVCEPSLARVARKLNLGHCLYMGRGEERSGGRERPSILADAFEALTGAIFIDIGLGAAEEFLLLHLKPVIGDVLEGKTDRDYKTELQEALQKKSPDPLAYVIIKEEGPDHHKLFTAGVVFKDRELGRGSGYSKKEAEQQAAREALENFFYDNNNFHI